MGWVANGDSDATATREETPDEMNGHGMDALVEAASAIRLLTAVHIRSIAISVREPPGTRMSGQHTTGRDGSLPQLFRHRPLLPASRPLVDADSNQARAWGLTK